MFLKIILWSSAAIFVIVSLIFSEKEKYMWRSLPFAWFQMPISQRLPRIIRRWSIVLMIITLCIACIKAANASSIQETWIKCIAVIMGIILFSLALGFIIDVATFVIYGIYLFIKNAKSLTTNFFRGFWAMICKIADVIKDFIKDFFDWLIGK